MPRLLRKRKAGIRSLKQKPADEFDFNDDTDAFGRIVRYEGSRVVRVTLDATLMSKPVLGMFGLIKDTVKTHEVCIKARGVTRQLHGSKSERKPKYINNWCIVRDGSLYMLLGSGDAHKLKPESVMIKNVACESGFEFDYSEAHGGDDSEADDDGDGDGDGGGSHDDFDIDAI